MKRSCHTFAWNILPNLCWRGPLTCRHDNKCCCCFRVCCVMLKQWRESPLCGFDEVVQDWLFHTSRTPVVTSSCTQPCLNNKHPLTPSAQTYSRTLCPAGARQDQIVCSGSVKWSYRWARCAAAVCFVGNQKVINHNSADSKSNPVSSIMQLQKVNYCRWNTLKSKPVRRAKGQERNENHEKVIDWGWILLLSNMAMASAY